MIQEIKRVGDVRTFFAELYAEGVSFHPDDLFEDYINMKTGEPCYTADEAKLRNLLMEQAFEVCKKEDVDIYEVGMDLFMKMFNATFSEVK
jgi:hypothetical protein